MTQKPSSACIKESCQDCEIYGKLMCKHTKQDLLDFFILIMNVFVPFFVGMIVGNHWVGLIGWFVLALLFFGYFEALLLCRHCPHYKEEGRILRCHANWGLPKFPSYDPRPMNRLERIAWIIYSAAVTMYWVPFFIYSQQWLFLMWASVSAFVTLYQLIHTKCNRCYMMSCPLNRVPSEIKKVFFEYYPEHKPLK